MEEREFEYYGKLDWLEPEEYYSAPWNYLEAAEADDGEVYAVVMHNQTGEWRYTIVQEEVPYERLLSGL